MDIDLSFLRQVETYDDWIGVGVDMFSARDVSSWQLGAWLCLALPAKPEGGRPAFGELTTARVARDLKQNPGTLSGLRWNWHFFSPVVAQVPDVATWWQCAEARRDSGWRPYMMDVASEYQDRALVALGHALDDGEAPRRALSADDILDRVRRDLRRVAEMDTPPEVKRRVLAALDVLEV